MERWSSLLIVALTTHIQMSAALSRDREDDDEHSRPQKRVKVDAPSTDAEETVGGETHCANSNCILPPSHVLLGDQLSSSSSCTTRQLLESDVGITEYISRDIPPVWGIIKQRCGLSFIRVLHSWKSRFTDFLVSEVDLDYQVVHLKSLDKPAVAKKDKKSGPCNTSIEDNPDNEASTSIGTTGEELPKSLQTSVTESSSGHGQPVLANEVVWDHSFAVALSPHFSGESIAQLEKMFLEGPEPKVDVASNSTDDPLNAQKSTAGETPSQQPVQEKQDRNRSSRGERGRKPRGRGETHRAETRKVFSEVGIFSRCLRRCKIYASPSPSAPKLIGQQCTRWFESCLKGSSKLRRSRPASKEPASWSCGQGEEVGGEVGLLKVRVSVLRFRNGVP